MAKSTKPRKGSKESSNSRRRKGSEGCEQKKGAAENKQQSWAVMKSILTCKHLQVEPQKQKQENDQINRTNTNTNINIIKRSSKKMRCSGSLSLCNNTNTNKVITERERRPTPTPIADHLQIASQSNNSPPDQHQLLLFHRRKVSASSSSSFSIISDQTGSSSRSFVSTSVTSSSLLSTASMNKGQGVTAASSGSFKGFPFRKLSLSGCSECTTVTVDPVLAGLTRDPSLRSTIASCPQCGDIFMKPDLLLLHLATKHAELGPEDTSRNIVEIIFQSSWLKKEAPVCKIDRILKVHNTSRTVSRFEEYRDMIKCKATRLPKKHPRCIADGNELLRFHCTTLMCSLGLNGSSNLCNSSPSCGVCGIIRDGFRSSGGGGGGILTTATSGRAHDQAEVGCRDHPAAAAADEPRKAMLVCRVIAGRVKKDALELGGVDGEYDSVAGVGGGPVYSDLDELYVYNPKAILPCFVVIYRGF